MTAVMNSAGEILFTACAALLNRLKDTCAVLGKDGKRVMTVGAIYNKIVEVVASRAC